MAAPAAKPLQQHHLNVTPISREQPSREITCVLRSFPLLRNSRSSVSGKPAAPSQLPATTQTKLLSARAVIHLQPCGRSSSRS